MGEWRYSSTFLNLGTRWRWVVSFTPQLLYPGERAPGTHWIGGWVGPRAGLDVPVIIKQYEVWYWLGCRDKNAYRILVGNSLGKWPLGRERMTCAALTRRSCEAGRSEQDGVGVMLLTCIQESLGSNLWQDNGYPEMLVVLLRPSGQMVGQHLDEATTVSFRIVSVHPE
jgi:hypothetical protein